MTNIEDVKNYWDKRPCNIRHSSQEVGTLKYFQEVTERKYFVEPHIPEFADFKNWNGKKVLEIGCGIGTDAVEFIRNGAIYSGVDLSTESLKLANLRLKKMNLVGNLKQGNAETINLIFPNYKFDLIYSFGVLHHTPNIMAALKSIRSLCNTSTIFKFMVYAKNSYKNALIKSGLEQPEAQSGCLIANTYTNEEINNLLKKSGFKLINIEQTHIFPFKVEKYVNYEYELEEWFACMPKEIFNALERNFGWHLL